ncbi:MAG TPA: hypothetical protein ENJ83_01655 [Rhodospirillales bacterium]|nr:hypothetical protein [Rhodospirillales bacterium]
MGSANTNLFVRSHVGRDLLQNAALFRHEKQVVWEYVANSLQYVDHGTQPVVRVHINKKAKRISIRDNGRGMTWDDLQNNFFVMHGENIDRKLGKPGRGMFGTGKSAAFGIGKILRITTVRSGKRSKVELRRSDIEKMNSGDPVPVVVIEKEVPTSESNGTLVEIEDIFRKSIDRGAITRFIEQHIARWPNATVSVDNRLCEYNEPPIAEEIRVRAEDERSKSALGDVELVIKVSKSPLEREQNGIAIFSQGVWHETTLAGCEGKEMAQYILGEIDVPVLANDTSPVPPFDLSRSMQLNRENELVRHLLSFIGTHVDRVRRRLVEQERQRRQTEEVKRLEREAAEIAKILNDDFNALRTRLAQMAARKPGGSDLYPEAGEVNATSPLLDPGEDIDAEPADIDGGAGQGSGEATEGREPPDLGEFLQRSDRENAPAKGKDSKSERVKRPRGGFSVEFRKLGETEARAKYEREKRTIYINLDHPQLTQALGLASIEEPAFRRLAYEVAFAEYAIALAYEMSDEGHFIDLEEPIFEIRRVLDRVTRAAAHLYRPTR